MKKLALSAFLLMSFCFTVIAQNGSGFGIKGGLNYNANGDYFASIGDNAENPDRNIGYHIGVFGKLGDKLFFRPELMYTATKSDYSDSDFDMKKLDLPLLIGVRVLGPVNVFGGPSLQYILDSDFGSINVSNIDNDFTVGLNFGIGLELNKIGLDLRYERGFSDNEANFLNNNGIDISRLDTRPDQLILSLSVKI
ncbi:outer membrane beta-barrel protein [Winogradskyella sp. 3972H.M.0a.05]|uniref:outer membrane beta-barrel protein n=1 Tax=Winogradskyella sp. 3972H.M.0a.05 TaxID=2950277 RepID=UPI00339292AF